MSTHISQIILEKIERENIKPKSRWYFVMEHAVLWIPGVLVTALGAVAVAGMLYSTIHSGWEYSDFVYPSHLAFLTDAIPFLWILSFVFFNSVIIKALRTTHSGYRLSAKGILLGSFATSVVLGIGIYTLDQIFEANSIIRYQVQQREQNVMSSLEKGRLVGRVEKKYGEMVTLRDRDNTLWNVDLSLLGSTTPTFVQEGKSINVIGTTTDEVSSNEEESDADAENTEKVFVACAVFPREGERLAHDASQQNNKLHGGRVRTANNNPDCKTLLEQIKKNVREE